GAFQFGIPDESQLKFFGDTEAAALYRRAIERFVAIGGVSVSIDFRVFAEAAELLYSGPWVAERFAAVGEFLSRERDGVNEVVKKIIFGGKEYSASDAFRNIYRLESLKQAAAEHWSHMDVLLLPTTGTIYTHEAVAADPVRLNSNLGYYTNFVNLMDLAAIAVHAAFRPNGLPFGISIIGPAFSDEALLEIAARYLGERTCDNVAHFAGRVGAPGCALLAVVGAHLSGQPLNHELTNRGARLVKTCRTTSA